jgi:hypothetical protein
VRDDADLIWNRSLDLDFEPTAEGDRALKAVLGFHSLAMNGGLGHSLETDFAQARQAADGFRFFGANELGLLVDEACKVVERLARNGAFDTVDLTDDEDARLQELESRYGVLVPSDGHLELIFHGYLAAYAEQFEPTR